MHEDTLEIPDGSRPQFSQPVLRTGVCKINTNNGDGTYVATEQVWDGSAWGNGTAPGHLVSASVRDRDARLAGAINDYAVFHELLKQDGSTEIVIDLTTTILWAKVTDVSQLSPNGEVSANPCDAGGTNVDSGTTLTLYANIRGQAPDTWIVPDISVSNVICYYPIPGSTTQGYLIAVKYKLASPNTGTLYQVSMFGCGLTFDGDMKLNDMGGVVQVYMSDGNWYWWNGTLVT